MLEELRRIVARDPELEASLQTITDRDAFIEAVVTAAAEHGLAVHRDELDDAMRAAGRRWIERWL